MNLIKYLVAFFVVFLTGCMETRTPAGQTCVSCKPYFVRGSWHFPQTHYEYDETGLASWYGGNGDGFHGKQKATGETFHTMSMTAAHKTLPLPSVVKVTNLRNGKSIVVVVDDRGPYYYQGRIIDLSYGAAKALDLHRYKPSQVRVQTIVADSVKLSNYIASYCKHRKDPFGRTWSQLYFQEIVGNGLKMYSAPQNPPKFAQNIKKLNTIKNSKAHHVDKLINTGNPTTLQKSEQKKEKKSTKPKAEKKYNKTSNQLDRKTKKNEKHSYN